MKLVRYGARGHEKPGLVDADGAIRDLSACVLDHSGATLSPAQLARLETLNHARLPLAPSDTRLGPPVAGVSKIVAVGLNYTDHAAETGLPLPTEPLLFMKATTAISGPDDPVMIPRGAEKTDWEVELAIVIGSIARYVSEHDALDYIAGYTICNDVSERALQMERQGQYVKGKSSDTFAPLGPWLVTKQEIAEPHRLSMWLDVNGERMQTGSTSKMIFGVGRIVSYVSEFMTLLPGDVITTGTPPGVGMGRVPPRFLKSGDIMRLGIEGLGEQCQTCIPWTPEPTDYWGSV